MNIERHDKTLLAALDKFGYATQMQMAIGEVGELLTLFGRSVQGRDSFESWIDEIADVTIMMRQLALMKGAYLVDCRIEEKMNRLRGKLFRIDSDWPDALERRTA